MKEKKLLFIYNPNSGHGNIVQNIDAIIKEFEEANYEVTVYRMHLKKDAPKVAAEKGANYDLIVAAGGDGTLNSVISGIMQIDKEKRPKVGFIPLGSTNDMKTSYEIPGTIVDAARTAVKGVPFTVDIGSCEGRYFTYVTSFGRLSSVSCFTPQSLKKIFGRAAYVSEGLKAILVMESYDIKATFDDDVTIEGDFFLGMTANAESVGGFQGIMGKHVDLQDGEFETILLKKPKDLIELKKIIDSLIITPDRNIPGSDDLVLKFKSKKVVFESKTPLRWVVDGEDAGEHLTYTVENCNKAIQIMTGKKALKVTEDEELITD